jgi:hypothetical protein
MRIFACFDTILACFCSFVNINEQNCKLKEQLNVTLWHILPLIYKIDYPYPFYFIQEEVSSYLFLRIAMKENHGLKGNAMVEGCSTHCSRDYQLHLAAIGKTGAYIHWGKQLHGRIVAGVESPITV